MERSIDQVLVVGAGTMGTQIAAVFARAGLTVAVADLDAATLERSATEAASRLRRLGRKGEPSDPEAAIARLRWTTDVTRAATSCDFAVEAASERPDIKLSLFESLGAAAPEHAILTTSSSTIPSSQVAAASGRPDRVCNMHFFNPALAIRCIEVVPNPATSAQTLAAVMSLADRIGKVAVRLRREMPGFIANRLMNAIQDEATRLYEADVASISDIDRAATLALGHPMGPFELMDFIGLDVIRLMHAAEASLTGDPSREARPALVELVESGRLGRKSGRGWYEYDSADA
jgi:3-hydroxybutyryl-CoA dehydrogenase